MIRTALIALAAIAALSGSASAQPRLDPSVQSLQVRYADLDLGTAAGARSLAFRVHVAANKVCGGEDPLLRTRASIGDCRKAASERALSSLDSVAQQSVASR